MLNYINIYLILQVKIGTKVATIKEQNSKDFETKSGKNWAGRIIPINIDFEKSGLGKNIIPDNKPIKIEV